MTVRFKPKPVRTVIFPKPTTEEDRGLDECCPIVLVLASISDSSSWKNDHELASIKKGLPADAVEFSITKCGIDGPLDMLGEKIVFPFDNLAEAYRFDWRQYATAYGFGKYTISRTWIIAGLEQSDTWGQFQLYPYNRDTAEGTTRLKTVFNSESRASGIDWTGSNAYGTIRVRGEFGDMEPNTTTKLLIDKGFSKVKTTTENLKEYFWRTKPLSYYFTSKIIDFHFRDGDYFYMTDENRLNHSYFFQDLPVSLSEKDVPKPEYNGGRTVPYEVKFTDFVLDQQSHYNVR